MHRELNLIRSIEQLTFSIWPALSVELMESWRLRAADGVTKRANSVFAPDRFPNGDHWMEQIHSFYRKHEVPVRFHISPVCPDALDPLLEELGYVCEGKSSVKIAKSATVTEKVPPDPQMDIVYFDRLNTYWLDQFMEIEGIDDSKKQTYQMIMERITGIRCFLMTRRNETPVGIGTAVIKDGWSGLLNIAVRPEYRNYGIGSQMVRALAEWSIHNGAERMYLQVVAHNYPALALYRKAGFEHLYDYHYRTL